MPGGHFLVRLFGECDRNLRKIREALRVEVSARDERIFIRGEEKNCHKAITSLERLAVLAKRNDLVTEDDVIRILRTIEEENATAGLWSGKPLEVFKVGKAVRPRTPGQARYIEAIRQNDIVFCHGPAGTGKTFLAVAAAVMALKKEEMRKIVLVRPAVEAGENLGFLPGDLQAKIDPYLRPLFDALSEMIDHDVLERYREMETIEVVPLAYMRGRTLSNAFIILDEAQNATVSQMKMFLTRMGEGSKIVVSGDTTQIDLPRHSQSGLLDAVGRLTDIDGIDSVQLSKSDIVRHHLVQKIAAKYEEM